jgi:glutamine amidotransferase
MKHQVVIADYGMGNLFNIQRVFSYLGVESLITTDPDVIKQADRLIIPGVGAFEEAMKNLRGKNMIEPITEFAQSGKPMLGICLGMQLLFTQSTEFGLHNGLNLIKGSVLKFDYPENETIKIPQIGWNSITCHPGNKHNILNGIPDGTYYYFIHSYYCQPDSDKNITATTIYGETPFCSVTNEDNIWGCQFHPERSADAGVTIFENFLKL